MLWFAETWIFKTANITCSAVCRKIWTRTPHFCDSTLKSVLTLIWIVQHSCTAPFWILWSLIRYALNSYNISTIHQHNSTILDGLFQYIRNGTFLLHKSSNFDRALFSVYWTSSTRPKGWIEYKSIFNDKDQLWIKQANEDITKCYKSNQNVPAFRHLPHRAFHDGIFWSAIVDL